jgi:hypothetical protein
MASLLKKICLLDLIEKSPPQARQPPCRIFSPLAQARGDVRFGLSALPPKADIVGRNGDVRFVPKADIAFLFEQLIGALLEKWGHVETELFGSF